MNIKNAEKHYNDLRKWYKSEIQKAADSVGGLTPLAELLGYDKLYLYKIMKPPRDTITALRKIYKKITLLS